MRRSDVGSFQVKALHAAFHHCHATLMGVMDMCTSVSLLNCCLGGAVNDLKNGFIFNPGIGRDATHFDPNGKSLSMSFGPDM